MRILVFSPYPEEAPSTRFRLVQFREPLAAEGIHLEIHPFFTPSEYGVLYQAGGSLRKAFFLGRGLHRRRRAIAAAGNADLVLVHRELAPVLGDRFLAGLLGNGVPVAFDFDDAIFLPSPGGSRLMSLFRRPREAFGGLCRGAGVVFSGNEHLAASAREARGRVEGVMVLPTVIDTREYSPGRRGEEGAPARVGWIGTQSTVPYLEAIYPELVAAARRLDFQLVVVSNRSPREVDGLPMVFRPWSAPRELEDLRSLDVGLYPLPENPWTLGKCGFKAIQYMACGVPVLASPVGVLKEMVVHGETGFHAVEGQDWVTHLAALLEDPSLRRRMGMAGRARTEERFSVDSVLPDLVRGLRSAARPEGSASSRRPSHPLGDG